MKFKIQVTILAKNKIIWFHFQLYHHLLCTAISQHHDNVAHQDHPGCHLDNMWGVSCAHGEILWLQVHHDLLRRPLHRLLDDDLLLLCLHVHAGTHPCQKDCSSAHQWQGEVSEATVVGAQHERGPDSNYPVWSICGVLGTIFPPPHHHHGVPHEPILRVLPIAVPAARGPADEPRPYRPSHLRLSQRRAQAHFQEDAAVFRLEAVLIGRKLFILAFIYPQRVKLFLLL